MENIIFNFDRNVVSEDAMKMKRRWSGMVSVYPLERARRSSERVNRYIYIN